MLPFAMACVRLNECSRLCDNPANTVVHTANGTRAIIWPVTLLCFVSGYSFVDKCRGGWIPGMIDRVVFVLLVFLFLFLLLCWRALGASDDEDPPSESSWGKVSDDTITEPL